MNYCIRIGCDGDEVNFDGDTYDVLWAVLGKTRGLVRGCASIFYKVDDVSYEVSNQESFKKFLNSESTELIIRRKNPTTPPREKQKAECPGAPHRRTSSSRGDRLRIPQPDF